MKSIIKKFSRELEVVAALAAIMVVFGVIQPIYFSPSNLLDILDQSVINGLLAIGMTPVSYTHLCYHCIVCQAHMGYSRLKVSSPSSNMM